MNETTLREDFDLNEAIEGNTTEVSGVYFGLMQNAEWVLWCKMDFTSYPVDKQVVQKQIITSCPKIEGFFLQACNHDIFDEDTWKVDMKLLKGSSRYKGVHLMSGNYIKQNGLNLDYDVTVKLEQKYMMLELEVTMKRKGLRSFIENIAPPGLLVAVSWVIFQISLFSHL